VEGRASPKGNGGQTTAIRTPSRGVASNRLEAVRQAARQSRDVRFTALLHHITVDLLKQSYHALNLITPLALGNAHAFRGTRMAP